MKRESRNDKPLSLHGQKKRLSRIARFGIHSPVLCTTISFWDHCVFGWVVWNNNVSIVTSACFGNQVNASIDTCRDNESWWYPHVTCPILLFLNILCSQRSIIVFALPTSHYWVCSVNFLWSCLLKSSRRPVLLRSTPWKLWMLFVSPDCSKKWWIWPSLKAILEPLAPWAMLRSVVHPVRSWMPVTLMQSPNSMSGMLWAFHQHRRLLWCPLAQLPELQPKLAFRWESSRWMNGEATFASCPSIFPLATPTSRCGIWPRPTGAWRTISNGAPTTMELLWRPKISELMWGRCVRAHLCVPTIQDLPMRVALSDALIARWKRSQGSGVALVDFPLDFSFLDRKKIL